MIINEAQRGKLHAVAITEAGAKHTAEDSPNQDCSGFLLKDNGFVLSVADGVGSCVNALEGSMQVCRICNMAFKALCNGSLPMNGTNIVEWIIQEWRKELSGKNEDDYCTTLKAAFLLDNRIILISLGDGIGMVAVPDQIIITPKNENGFLNETVCFSSQTNKNSFSINEIDVGNSNFVVFLTTDGIANHIIDGQEESFIQYLRDDTLSENLRVELSDFVLNVRTLNADDKTLGVVKRDC